MDWHSVNDEVYVLFCVFCAISYFFNFIVIAIFIYLTIKKDFNVSNFLLFIQSLTNLIATISMTLEAYFLAEKGFPGNSLERNVYEFFAEYWRFVMITTMFTITLDLYLSVTYFDDHVGNRFGKYTAIYSIINLFLSTVPAIIFCVIHSYFLVYHIMLGLLTYGFVIAIYALLVMSYNITRCNLKRKKPYRDPAVFNSRKSIDASDEEEMSERKKHFQLLIILAIMTTCYTVGYTPEFICEVIVRKGHDYLMYYAFLGAFFFTAIINPLLIIFVKHDYRDSFIGLFKRDSENAELISFL